MCRSWLLRDVGNDFNIDEDEEIPEQLQASAEEEEEVENREEEEAHIVPYDEEEEEGEEYHEMRERNQYPLDHNGSLLREEVWGDHSNEEEEGLRRRNVSGETM